MKIEHVAIQVKDTVAVTDWYCKNLGFSIKRSADNPKPVRFLADATGQVMIEIYTDPNVGVPDYQSMHPLLLHLAFVCETVEATAERLRQAGAELISGPEQLGNGDVLAMLRDPWGFSIQLCCRANPMV